MPFVVKSVVHITVSKKRQEGTKVLDLGDMDGI
jgi:hypothetical protein